MKTLARLIVVGLTFVPVSAAAQAPTVSNQAATAGIRLGCVSPQRAFAESPDGKVATARLAALREEKERAIGEKNKALQTEEAALQQNGSVLSQEMRTQRNNAIEKFRIDVQRFIQDAQAELAGVQREVENSFVFKFGPAVEKVAKEKGLQLVLNLDDGLISWADPSLDITGEVVKQLAPVSGNR